ncbi:ATP-binding protein [Rhizobium leucaenae]|uniref:histidine kinase n=1 Tax=Rhizobium leucaenae TaxID=29450 RepID=A0A7W6ZV11_9HYPH|nr:ATP-binding protein [Rhizobium leucaenae]MBB4569273.1 signal transduction histidine kinase/DNA-binding response OmpR family regulator [Rhizobium leucaenae]MBB6302725.1 signal transduction histidine kinase/DNA-binding response OmpR family regulator [Rhizobium leucaenae]
MNDHELLATTPDYRSLNFLTGGGDMGELIRGHRWAATPLGSPDTWPQSLKTAVRIMLTSRQPIWIGWGSELIYLYNDAYRSIIGGKHPWALGRPTAEVWQEIWPDIGPMLGTAMGGLEGTYVEEQLLIMERHGYPEETYYTFSYSPIPDDDGTPGGIICANTDDTQRVIGERQLKLLRELAAETTDARLWSEACQRSIAALATDPLDITFALLYMIPANGESATLCACHGLPEEHPLAPKTLSVASNTPWPLAEILRRHETILIEDMAGSPGKALPKGAWDKATTRAAVLAVLPSGENGRSGVLVVGLNPYRLFDESYRGFLSLAAGQIAAAIANADAYEEERRRVEALAELDRAKTAFFSNISHEFRTPLTLMLGPLEEVLSGQASAEEVRTQVELAHRNGTRLLRLVNNLLDFSRIEAGRVRATYEPTDLSSFSAEIASGFRSATEKAGLQLSLQCRSLPQPVYLDRDMWEKVLLNLLSNAFKFTLEGEISVSVDVSADGHTAKVKVGDTGIGIPANEIPKLFERFHRIEGAQGRSFEGSGIGLALVHELVKLHGGDITVESTLDRGTVFTVSLPFGKEHLPAEHVHEEVHQSSKFATVRAREFVEDALRWLPDGDARLEERDAFSVAGLSAIAEGRRKQGSGKHILLVDDNGDMRAYVYRLLDAQGYTVDMAADGEAALAAARRRTPDLILTDVMMPKLDGFGLLKSIRTDPLLMGTPVIMLSARAGEEAKVEGLEAGADDYLIKPFTARELLARVHSNIQMAEVRREASRAVSKSEQRYLMTQDRLKLALSTGRVAVFEWEVKSDRFAIQGPMAEMFGVAVADAEAGLPLETFFHAISPEDLRYVRSVLNRSVKTGELYETEYRVHSLGQERVIIARGRVETDSNGHKRISGVVIDVTEEKAAATALLEQTRALAVLNRAASEISGDLDQERLVQTITDAAVEITGAEFGAFFYNVVDTLGERYTLYSLSGAPREAFSQFPMPRNTQVFAPTFTGAAVVRSPDITKDPRYGRMAPHHGMPKGHLPVRSYLAVPVKSREGEVLGGLFFGHSETGVFDKIAEDRVVSLASQAAIALDNARLFQAADSELQQRRRAESELQALNANLEERVATEVARRAKAEDALRQAQKMEAVGQLTGGVAHDFNNLLTIIIGGLDTIKRSKPEDHARIARAVDMALQGAQRAASLTGRLLAFSRRQPLEPKPLDLNVLVREMTELLHRTLGEEIELEGVLAPRLWSIEADQNQLENAILNLAVNARDAMPDGGRLTIETANIVLDETYAAVDSEVVPGQYVMIAVSDNGSGMATATVARVFEPFFTTKEAGRGTGLGLSMVYGFVKQSGGHVTVYSEEGQGTRVKLYFPRYFGSTDSTAGLPAKAVPTSSEGEVVLVVEDNDDVRAYSTTILTELGYTVLEAAEAEAALAILRTDRRIDLLFTDVILPGKTGRMLADAASELRPALKVLFTTGYSRNAIVHQGRLDPGVQLVSKPFTFEQLASRVRDVLDQGGRG